MSSYFLTRVFNFSRFEENVGDSFVLNVMNACFANLWMAAILKWCESQAPCFISVYKNAREGAEYILVCDTLDQQSSNSDMLFWK